MTGSLARAIHQRLIRAPGPTGQWSLDRVLMVAALGIGIALAIAQIAGRTPLAFDAGAYWHATPGDLYQADWGVASGQAAFLYSPAFADALAPFRLLPERVFAGLWQLGLVAVLVATIRGWALLALVAAVPFLAFSIGYPLALVAADIAHGNIHVLLGAVAVFGLRWPALWSIALLSKVTPGIGLVWFVARREWRNLGIALGATLGVAALSFAYRPSDWGDWFAFLFASRDHEFLQWTVPISLPIRLAMSAALVWWGGRTDRPWTVPLAVGWAIPLAYPTMLATMVCALAYVRRRPTCFGRPRWKTRAEEVEGRLTVCPRRLGVDRDTHAADRKARVVGQEPRSPDPAEASWPPPDREPGPRQVSCG